MRIETGTDMVMEMPEAVPAHRRYSALVIKVATSRDRAAFTEIFDYYAPRLKAYVMRQGSDAQQAEEIMQDAMIVLWNKAALFDPSKSSVSTWLYRVARNRRIDLLRRDKSDRIDPNDPIFHPSDVEPADTGLDAEQRDERVRAAMAKLSPEQLDLIRQAFFDGKSHSQIAVETDLPLGTVKSRIRLAFKRLREELEADPKIDTDL